MHKLSTETEKKDFIRTKILPLFEDMPVEIILNILEQTKESIQYKVVFHLKDHDLLAEKGLKLGSF